MYKTINLIVENLKDSEQVNSIVQYLDKSFHIDPQIYGYKQLFDKTDSQTLFLLYLTDDELKSFMFNHTGKELCLGILPNDKCALAMKNYGISKDLFEAIEDAVNEELFSKIDLLTCNEMVVFNRVAVGDMHGLNALDINNDSKFMKLRFLFDNIRNLKFSLYTLTTAKEQKIQIAASGITVLEQTAASEKSAIGDEFSIYDGKLNAFVLAPASLLSYIWYLVLIFVYQKISLVSLPKSMGFIKTSKLAIESNKPMDYILDGHLLSTKSISLEVLPESVSLHLGRTFKAKVLQRTAVDEKETIKVNTLPTKEVSDFLLEGQLPLFKRAADEDFKELFIALRSNAKVSVTFLVLMALSTLLATTGLFANSSPVIIGAMILAPLMNPIVSLSMSVVRAERTLFIKSTVTLIVGIVLALMFSGLLTLLIPIEQLTYQMQGRLHPNLLDLMVAVFSGVAAAYANAKEDVAKSLAGVAIAVALVPPLSVAGIGIGMMNAEVMYGSFFLFLTNLIGIMLSASITFIVLGYSPVKRASKGLLYTSVLMVLITIPLYASFSHIVQKSHYFTLFKPLSSLVVDQKKIQLNIIDMDVKKNEVFVKAEVVSSETLTHKELETVKEELEKKSGKKVVLEATLKLLL